LRRALGAELASGRPSRRRQALPGRFDDLEGVASSEAASALAAPFAGNLGGMDAGTAERAPRCRKPELRRVRKDVAKGRDWVDKFGLQHNFLAD
jgi:hypothetical protein